MKHFPSFSALRAFEAVAKFGSLKLAANKLNITPSAISHQIRRLEKDLNVTLFERTSSGVIVTETGTRYLESIQSALETIEKATVSISKSKNIEVLKISTLSTLSILWLIPKLKIFHQQHPEIRVDLLDDVDLCDFTKTDLDAAIRYDFYGKAQWPELTAIPLIEENLVPVCSAKFLAQHPDIVDIESMKESRLLVNYRHPDEWDKWFESMNVTFLTQNHASHVVLDTSNMTLTAAKNNLGIALGRTPFVDEFLNNGELVRINPAVQYRGVRHYLVFPKKINKKDNFNKFKDWLVETASTVNAEYSNF